jgi:hypothetical protein
MTGSSEPVHEAIRGEIEVLVTRYELADGAADALQGLVRLADWGQPNFVPKADPTHRMEVGKNRPTNRQRRLATRMLAESLAGLELGELRAARRLADIGTGAGFPGLVLAVGLPQTRVVLIEKRSETCRFLRRAISEMGLDNVKVVEQRVQQWREGVAAFDMVTSRNAARMEAMVVNLRRCWRPAAS